MAEAHLVPEGSEEAVAEPQARAVAAVVVSYNAAAHLERCLITLAAEGVGTVVVVDNGSRDGSEGVALAGAARWVPTGANLGYGRAANRGVASLPPGGTGGGPSSVLVCNPDVELRPGAVAALQAALDADPALAVVGPRLVNPDGTLYPSARAFPDLLDAVGHGLLGTFAPRNRFTRRYRLLDWDHRDAARVDWVSGACFLARRAAWDAVGGFDPAYFMYLEDVDLCWRLRQAGWVVGYEPAAEALHVQGVSASLHPYRMMAAHHRSLWRFATRTSEGPRRAALPLVAAGLAGRLGFLAARYAAGQALARRQPAR